MEYRFTHSRRSWHYDCGPDNFFQPSKHFGGQTNDYIDTDFWRLVEPAKYDKAYTCKGDNADNDCQSTVIPITDFPAAERCSSGLCTDV
jgi:hypothetical protein